MSPVSQCVNSKFFFHNHLFCYLILSCQWSLSEITENPSRQHLLTHLILLYVKILMFGESKRITNVLHSIDIDYNIRYSRYSHYNFFSFSLICETLLDDSLRFAVTSRSKFSRFDQRGDLSCRWNIMMTRVTLHANRSDKPLVEKSFVRALWQNGYDDEPP